MRPVRRAIVENPVDGEAEFALWLENVDRENPRILQVLVERYASGMHRFLFANLNGGREAASAGDIETILAAVFSRAILNLEHFRGYEGVQGWLYGFLIAEIHRFNRRRAWGRIINPGGGRNERTKTDPFARPIDSLGEEQFQVVQRGLPEKERLIILLRYLSALSVREIAKILVLAAQRVHQTLEGFREDLSASIKIHESGIFPEMPVHPEVRRQIHQKVDGMLDADPAAQIALGIHLSACSSCSDYSRQIDHLEGEIAHWVEVSSPPSSFGVSDQEKILRDVQGRIKNGGKNIMVFGTARPFSWLVIGILAVAGTVWLFDSPETPTEQELPRSDLSRSFDAHLSARISPRRDSSTPSVSINTQPLPTPLVFSGTESYGISPPQDSFGLGSKFYYLPSISDGGRWISFVLDTTSIVQGEVSVTNSAHIYDRELGTISSITRTPSGPLKDGTVFDVEISSNGRWMVYTADRSGLPSDLVRSCAGPHEPVRCTDVLVFDQLSGEVTNISVYREGELSDGPSLTPAISSNGRFITFWSSATDLTDDGSTTCLPKKLTSGESASASGDPVLHTCWNLYIFDQATLVLERLPVGRRMGDTGWRSLEKVPVSDDGRWLAITLHARDQIAVDLNLVNLMDVYLYDRMEHNFEPVNISSEGDQGGEFSAQAVLSPDGRYIAFASLAGNLLAGDSNDQIDIFLRDRLLNQTERISVSSSGDQANDDSGGGSSAYSYARNGISISDNGRFVAFVSDADNLVLPRLHDCHESVRELCTNVYLRDRLAGTTEAVVVDPTPNRVFHMPRISSDGEWLTLVREDLECPRPSICSSVLVVNLRDKEIVSSIGDQFNTSATPHKLLNHYLSLSQSGGASSLAFSPDGKLLAAGSNHSSVQVWQVRDGQLIGSMEMGELPVSGVDFSPYGRVVAFGSHDGLVRLFGPYSKDILRKMDGYSSSILSLAYSPGGNLLAVGADGGFWIWRTQWGKNKLFDRFEYPGTQTHTLDFSPDGRWIALGQSDGTIWLYDINQKKVLIRLAGHKARVLSVEFSPDGRYIASSSDDTSMILWEVEESGDVRVKQDYAMRDLDWINDLAFSPDGKMLATASFNGVRFWRVPDMEPLKTDLDFVNFQSISLAFSSDGRHLAVGSSSGDIRLWEIISTLLSGTSDVNIR